MASPEEILARAEAPPPDWVERRRALDPGRSILVQAPAGSGKTDLLTKRFLTLLAVAEKPDEIVAITFTNAAAAEMRTRILNELEKAERLAHLKGETRTTVEDADTLPELAQRALDRAKGMGWQILDQPGQLRITTIDAFCRGLALQSPLSWGLLSDLGGKLEPVSNPKELYRRAARRTLRLLEAADSPERQSVEELLLWRDNNWKDLEDLIAEMLGVRNRWYQVFVFARAGDWDALRKKLEAPFRRAARERLRMLGAFLDGLTGSREFALELARFACRTPGRLSPHSLAERVGLPLEFSADEGFFLEDAVDAYRCLACFLLTNEGQWRKQGGLNLHHGFPAGSAGKAQKDRFGEFVRGLAEEPGLQAALSRFQSPMPVGYTDEEWKLVRHCFTVLRSAAVELQLVFAETGTVDFTEVAQIALRILAPESGFPSDFALRQAEGIRHLLIDEFQDTSRSQHELLSRLIGAWPEREGRSCFCVGDPMQSIYSFREAEVELFERAKTEGLSTASSDPDSLPFRFEAISLRANFRTVPSLVEDLNGQFKRIFAEDDGSGVQFSEVEAARESQSKAKTELHLAFTRKGDPTFSDADIGEPESTRRSQFAEIAALIQRKLKAAAGLKRFRIAVLGRTKNSVIRVAEALRAAGVAFRAIDLVPLRERPEVLDVLSLARALLNPTDRTAWLGLLRAPWCGLSLEELHLLTSADDAEVSATPVPELLESRLRILRDEGRLGPRAYVAAANVASTMKAALEARAAGANLALGSQLESIWKALGGLDTVNREQCENLRLLWVALDKLPEGELDLLGPGMNSALEELCAQPDPEASGDFGVQLMTIHKSKGLEFEVVIVPDLEAESRKFDRSLMSWLERGLAGADSGEEELTEFLIAPIQAKGADSGEARNWVERVKRERAAQELRRVLYVAATRAREELHLFARPRFKVSRESGMPELCKASGLLATAWAALGEEVETRFAAWLREIMNKQAPVADAEWTGTLAAEGGTVTGKLLTMPSSIGSVRAASRPTILKRLPAGYEVPGLPRWTGSRRREAQENQRQPYSRTEGGLESRVLGDAVHSLLQYLSKTPQRAESGETSPWEGELRNAIPGLVATIRGNGFALNAAQRLAAQALEIVQKTAADPIGAWILAPHSEAETESRWTGLSPRNDGREQRWNFRPDRVFFAAASDFINPESLRTMAKDVPVWWIVDYKTSAAAGVDLAVSEERLLFLEEHRKQHSGQLAAYAQVFRGLRGADEAGKTIAVRAGIYYPRLQLFDFWEA